MAERKSRLPPTYDCPLTLLPLCESVDYLRRTLEATGEFPVCTVSERSIVSPDLLCLLKNGSLAPVAVHLTVLGRWWESESRSTLARDPVYRVSVSHNFLQAVSRRMSGSVIPGATYSCMNEVSRLTTDKEDSIDALDLYLNEDNVYLDETLVTALNNRKRSLARDLEVSNNAARKFNKHVEWIEDTLSYAAADKAPDAPLPRVSPLPTAAEAFEIAEMVTPDSGVSEFYINFLYNYVNLALQVVRAMQCDDVFVIALHKIRAMYMAALGTGNADIIRMVVASAYDNWSRREVDVRTLNSEVEPPPRHYLEALCDIKIPPKCTAR